MHYNIYPFFFHTFLNKKYSPPRHPAEPGASTKPPDLILGLHPKITISSNGTVYLSLFSAGGRPLTFYRGLDLERCGVRSSITEAPQQSHPDPHEFQASRAPLLVHIIFPVGRRPLRRPTLLFPHQKPFAQFFRYTCLFDLLNSCFNIIFTPHYSNTP